MPARQSSSCACRLGCRQCGPGTTGPVRSPSEIAESARRVGSCHGGPGRCRLWRALVLAASRRSRPASPSGQRSAPLLCGHALAARSEEHTSELQSLAYLVCRLLLEKKKINISVNPLEQNEKIFSNKNTENNSK